MRVRLGDVDIGWDEVGRGTPLLLLHAFPLDRRMWQGLGQALAPGARVVTMDARGFGESTGAGTIDDFADDAAALLDHLGVARAVVGGLSMGGYVALAFARRHADRLSGLLLADTRAGADNEAGRAGRDAAIARVAGEGPAGFVGEFVPKLVAPEHRKALDLALAIAAQQTALGVAGALAALRDRPDATAGLARIAVPTQIIVGALDALTPPTEARALAAAIPGATQVEIAGAGHLSVLEAPDEFADAVRALLRRVPA